VADVLTVSLGDLPVGAITALGGDRSVFTFDPAYLEDPAPPVLSVGFKNAAGRLITEHNATQTRLLPYFSNLLPEGSLRDYLAERAGVKPGREFFLLWALGSDLPGAVTVHTADGEPLPPGAEPHDEDGAAAGPEAALRFSLAGVQLKFSAVEKAPGGLTIPAHGVGGDWIVKLPSTRYAGVSENEFSMMTLAAAVGIEVPEIRLLALDEIGDLPRGVGRLEGAAYAIRRFDRPAGGGRVHMEDFAQVFGVYPEAKYDKASYRGIAQVIWRETGEAGLVEFIRRLVFSALIGNADMHLKNWSLLYRDGITPTLAPAYDFVATVAYLADDKAALKVARSKSWTDFNTEELRYMAHRAGLPETLVLDTAKETVARFRDVWAREKDHLPHGRDVVAAVEAQLVKAPLAAA
jgi:serine/threonine-protein kinase HipA